MAIMADAAQPAASVPTREARSGVNVCYDARTLHAIGTGRKRTVCFSAKNGKCGNSAKVISLAHFSKRRYD